ncbi:uncharacterized protein [Typha angustifolia]|uniref:uncharacterized protein isoform X2 n=1 Tax=Typha angustifolia TaxID=59011 RepID=UPI003C2CFC59
MKHIDLDTLENRSLLSRRVPGKDFMNRCNFKESLSYHDEHEKGVCEEAQSSMLIKDISSIVYEEHSERTSYDHDELEEGEIREEEESVQGKDAARILSDDSMLEIILYDAKGRGNRDITVGQSSVLEESGSINFRHQPNQNITSVTTEELEEGEIKESFNCTECSEQPTMVDLEKGGHLKKQIDEICSGRLQQLLSKQKAELKMFKTQKRKEEAELVAKHYWDLDLTHRMHIVPKVRYVKTELLKQKFTDLMTRFDKHMQLQFRRFIVMQIQARNREKNIKKCWTEEAKAGTLEKSFYDIPLSDTGFKLEKFESGEQEINHGGPGKIRPLFDSSSDLRESVESKEMRGLATEIAAVGSARESKNMLTESDIPASQPICSNLMEDNEITGPSSLDSVITEHVREENSSSSDRQKGDMLTEMVTLASPPKERERRGVFETSGPNSNFSEVIQHGGEENVYQGTATPVSQSDKISGALNNFKEDSRTTVTTEEKHRATGSDGALSANPCSQSLKELYFSAYVSTNSRCVESPLCGALHSFKEDSRTTVTTEEKPRATGSDGALSADPCSQSLKELSFSAYVSTNSRCVESPLCGEAQVMATTPQVEQHNHSSPQPFMNSVLPTISIQPARAQSEYLSPSNVQLERARQFPVSYTLPQSRPQGLDLNLLDRELTRLRKINEIITQRHEQKREELKSNCQIEINKVRRKYDELIRDFEIEHLQSKKKLEIICDKIHKHQMLAEGFEIFANPSGRGTDAHQGLSSMTQFIQVSQPQFAPCPASVPISASTLISFPSQSPISSERPFGSSFHIASSVQPVLAAQCAPTVLSSSLSLPHPNVMHSAVRSSAGYMRRAPAPHAPSFRPTFPAAWCQSFIPE